MSSNVYSALRSKRPGPSGELDRFLDRPLGTGGVVVLGWSSGQRKMAHCHPVPMSQRGDFPVLVHRDAHEFSNVFNREAFGKPEDSRLLGRLSHLNRQPCQRTSFAGPPRAAL